MINLDQFGTIAQYPEITREQAAAILMLESSPQWMMLLEIQQEYIRAQKEIQCRYDHKATRGEIDEGAGIIKGMGRISLLGFLRVAKMILEKRITE